MNSSSMTSPTMTIVLPEKRLRMSSTRFRFMLRKGKKPQETQRAQYLYAFCAACGSFFYQFLYGRIDLLYRHGFDAQRRVGHQATIARTRIALKRILDDTMIHAPWMPSARIRRPPDGNCRRSYRRRKMHRTGVVADVECCAAHQFGNFGNGEAQQNHALLDLARNLACVHFLARTRRDDDRQAAFTEVSRYVGEAGRFPAFRRHDGSWMDHSVLASLQCLLDAGCRSSMFFETQRRSGFLPETEPAEDCHRGLDGVHRGVRRRHA